jgi:small-conductance mechanosensitive channel
MSPDITIPSLNDSPAEKGFSFLGLALFLAPLSALAAIITGHRGHHQIKLSNGELSGKKLSRAGLILGYLYFAICILLLILAAAIFGGVVHGISSLLGSMGIQ